MLCDYVVIIIVNYLVVGIFFTGKVVGTAPADLLKFLIMVEVEHIVVSRWREFAIYYRYVGH